MFILFCIFLVLAFLVLTSGEPIGIVFGIAAALCLVCHYTTTEASMEQHAKIGVMVKEYPELKPLVLKSNEDGKITLQEFDKIESKYNRVGIEKDKQKLIPALIPDTQPNSQ